MSRLKREQILKQKNESFAETVAISVLTIMSVLLSIVFFASVIGVYYAFGLSVVGYILLVGLIHAVLQPDSPLDRLFDTFTKKNKNFVDTDSEHEIHIPEDENPVYIGGREETNFTEREDRKVEPGEKVTLKRESAEEISVEGAVTDTISTGGGSVTKVEEKYGPDMITYINLSETSEKETTDAEKTSNTEAKDSTKDSGVSPVAGVILMIAVAVVVVVAIALIALLSLTSAFDSQLQVLEQYVVPLGIVSVVAPPVLRHIESALESPDILTEIRLETYIDDDEEDQGKVATIDMEDLEYQNYIAVPNDSNPCTWAQETTLSKDSPKIHFFSDAVDSPGTVEVDGKAIHPINEYGPCNAKYNTLEKITIYNTEYEELVSVSVPN